MEEWRNVPGSKGQYEIKLTENGGICRSTNYKGTGRVKEFSNTPAQIIEMLKVLVGLSGSIRNSVLY